MPLSFLFSLLQNMDCHVVLATYFCKARVQLMRLDTCAFVQMRTEHVQEVQRRWHSHPSPKQDLGLRTDKFQERR